MRSLNQQPQETLRQRLEDRIKECTRIARETRSMSDKSLIRILCVDDHPLLLDGVAALIGTNPNMKLVARATSGVEAVRQFRATLPDITLMDVQMKDMNGIDAIGAIRAEWPWAKIIVLSKFGGDAM